MACRSLASRDEANVWGCVRPWPGAAPHTIMQGRRGDAEMADGMTDAALLLRADAGGIARLTLNRPAARNGLSLALMRELRTALAAVAADAAVRVVLLDGKGPAFCAGHDLREITAHF